MPSYAASARAEEAAWRKQAVPQTLADTWRDYYVNSAGIRREATRVKTRIWFARRKG